MKEVRCIDFESESQRVVRADTIGTCITHSGGLMPKGQWITVKVGSSVGYDIARTQARAWSSLRVQFKKELH